MIKSASLMRFSLNRLSKSHYRSNYRLFSIAKIDYNFSDGIGHLANANATCQVGGTFVHTAVCTKSISLSEVSGSGLPLTIEYKIRAYAHGVIPGSIQRRERHGSEEETLVSRVIDRSIRPVFSKGSNDQEIQITSTCHSIDKLYDPIVAAVNCASFALMKSSLKFNGPIGCVRIGRVDGTFILNPSEAQLETSDLDLLVSGTADNVLM